MSSGLGHGNNQSVYEREHGLVGLGAYRFRHSWEMVVVKGKRWHGFVTCRHCGIGPYQYGRVPKEYRGVCSSRLARPAA